MPILCINYCWVRTPINWISFIPQRATLKYFYKLFLRDYRSKDLHFFLNSFEQSKTASLAYQTESFKTFFKDYSEGFGPTYYFSFAICASRVFSQIFYWFSAFFSAQFLQRNPTPTAKAVVAIPRITEVLFFVILSSHPINCVDPQILSLIFNYEILNQIYRFSEISKVFSKFQLFLPLLSNTIFLLDIIFYNQSSSISILNMKNCATQQAISCNIMSEKLFSLNKNDKKKETSLKAIQLKISRKRINESMYKYSTDQNCKYFMKESATTLLNHFLQKYAVPQSQKVCNTFSLLINDQNQSKNSTYFKKTQHKELNKNQKISVQSFANSSSIFSKKKYASNYFNSKSLCSLRNNVKWKCSSKMNKHLQSFQLSQLKYRINKQIHQLQDKQNRKDSLQNRQINFFAAQITDYPDYNIMTHSLINQNNGSKLQIKQKIHRFQLLQNQTSEAKQYFNNQYNVFKRKCQLNKIDYNLVRDLSDFVNNFAQNSQQ